MSEAATLVVNAGLLLPAGYEQLLRVYDLEQLNSEPLQLEKAEDKIRIATWHQQDNLLLSSYIDRKGFR